MQTDSSPRNSIISNQAPLISPFINTKSEILTFQSIISEYLENKNEITEINQSEIQKFLEDLNSFLKDINDKVDENDYILNDLYKKNKTAISAIQNLMKEKESSSSSNRKLIEEYMHTLMVERLGITERQFQEMQWIAYEHRRTENNQNLFHWHILANRIVIDGTLVSDSHIGKKAISVANAMSEKYGLSNAQVISQRNKREIQEAAFNVLGKMPEFSFDLFKRLMSENGHPIREAYSKSGRMQGYYIAASSGTEYKASEIDRSLTLGRIEDTWLKLNTNVLKKHVSSRLSPQRNPKRQSREIPRVWNSINPGASFLPRFKGYGSSAAAQDSSQSAASNDRRLDDEEWEAKRRKGLSM